MKLWSVGTWGAVGAAAERFYGEWTFEGESESIESSVVGCIGVRAGKE
jgi:hypothetical protein